MIQGAFPARERGKRYLTAHDLNKRVTGVEKDDHLSRD